MLVVEGQPVHPEGLALLVVDSFLAGREEVGLLPGHVVGVDLSRGADRLAPGEVLLLTFVLRAAWTWPRNARAAAGRDLTQARA